MSERGPDIRLIHSCYHTTGLVAKVVWVSPVSHRQTTNRPIDRMDGRSVSVFGYIVNFLYNPNNELTRAYKGGLICNQVSKFSSKQHLPSNNVAGLVLFLLTPGRLRLELGIQVALTWNLLTLIPIFGAYLGIVHETTTSALTRVLVTILMSSSDLSSRITPITPRPESWRLMAPIQNVNIRNNIWASEPLRCIYDLFRPEQWLYRLVKYSSLLHRMRALGRLRLVGMKAIVA
ncbi:hypothetical protein ARMSODRAFT_973141 [Armillaria solidipes]|uniref:Uncharacterized protein n=1 Tax=Armillaria solidipes TaxID=1076256 RepID=A0A2H3C2L4_9AGAR|nr:hypothetical protein ARMSODRAFT_973141 [Armillaria solidipes]